MARAGQALFQSARARWPAAKRWLVVSGLGNNGGDGYVVAQLARQAGMAVEIVQLGDPARIRGDALSHFKRAQAAGVPVSPWQGGELPAADLIFDGIFGIGLDREVTGSWREMIERVNSHPAPVVAIDIPSGLDPDCGVAMGVSIEADLTVSFIGLKQGLFTAEAPNHTGEVGFAGLGVPARILAAEPVAARRLDWPQLCNQLPRRQRTAHKGDCGHVLVIGGAPGFAGAARLAGEGALRAGAGLVSLATHPDHAACISQQRPELMSHGISSVEHLGNLLKAADVVVVGPGLGQSVWSRMLFDAVVETDLPFLVDADGLNLLAQSPRRLANAVITPHPGEAARLLEISSAEVQHDRFTAVESLRQGFAPVAVLKGAGTLISSDGGNAVGLCSAGNPGMASGGMGDVLGGIIAALIGQGLGLTEAAELGVVLHAEAADRAARETGERSLLAGDLIAQLPAVLREAE